LPDAPRALALRRATPEDVDAVHALLAAAGEHLARRGWTNWLPPYARDRLAADVVEREMWMAHDDEGALVATFTLAPSPPIPYEPPPWPEPALPARYLNRLAVDPAQHGRGLGAWCLGEIDRIARESGAAAVRCDVLAANASLCAFYERHGYVRHGERSRRGWTFACCEGVL
jgi:GNAT superfamily N-acetyltransferase